MRVLAIDFGRRRIGLALSDPTGMLARPWKVVPGAGNPAQVAARLATEIGVLVGEDDGLGAVVVGLPRHLDGSAHDLSVVVQRLADRLRRLIPVPVVLQDERLTSDEAGRLLAARERDWRRRKPELDAMAAAVILQDYLDGGPHAVRASGDPGGQE